MILDMPAMLASDVPDLKKSTLCQADNTRSEPFLCGEIMGMPMRGPYGIPRVLFYKKNVENGTLFKRKGAILAPARGTVSRHKKVKTAPLSLTGAPFWHSSESGVLFLTFFCVKTSPLC